MNEEELAGLLGICCQNTCGCGNQMIKYEKGKSYDSWFLTCNPFNETYKHPMKVKIARNCQLLKDHYTVERIKEFFNEFGDEVTVEEVKKMLFEECDYCWDPEKIGYETMCPKCGRTI